MKEAGTAHWASPNTGATNSSGFTALPGGYRSDTPGLSGINTMGLFWSATSKDSSPPENQAWHRILYSSYELTYRSYNTKPTGYSVRCLKN
jgi:uncharacterized protein (TIGR02145 family)